MRKILTGVLGVAGLLAVVMALSAPATAQQQKVVTFTSGTDPGTYTVSWETSGACDPSSPGGDVVLATDGASGSKSMTVRIPGTITDAANEAGIPDSAATDAASGQGTVAQLSVSIGTHCTYNFKYSFTSSLAGSKGVSCVAAVATDTPDLTAASPSATVSVDRTTALTCDETGTITVTINSGDDGSDTDDGAILATTFTVTATPVKDSADDCAAVTEETEASDTNDDDQDDTVSAKLTVVHTTLGQDACVYDLKTDVPDGFVTTARGSNTASKVGFNPDGVVDGNPGATGVVNDNDAGTADTAVTAGTSTAGEHCGESIYPVDADNAGEADLDADVLGTVVCDDNAVTSTASVIVATRSVYILQNVVGNSDGGRARYTLTEDKACGIPADLPDPLTGTGGIDEVPGTTVVELREGYFNISEAVLAHTDGTDDDPPHAPRLALNEEADTCVVTASVSHLPAHCSAADDSIEANLVSGVDGRGRAIIRFDITCEEAAPEPAPAPAPADDGAMDDGAMDDGAMDDGAMDDGAMDDGAMDDGAMDDAMGPPEDVATG